MSYGYHPAIKNLIEALRVLEREGHEFTFVSVGDPQKTLYKLDHRAKNWRISYQLTT